MGLRDTIARAAQTAIRATGDIAVSGDYHSLTASVAYDASAGVSTPTYATVPGVVMVFTTFELKEIDGQKVDARDKMALISRLDLGTVEPTVNDRILVSSAYWNVQQSLTDPADALWRLHIRRV